MRSIADQWRGSVRGRSGRPVEPLDARRLLAVAWNVTFDDPGNVYAAYHEPMRQTIRAAGADWVGVMQLTASSSIEVIVDFHSPQPRGGGRSATTSFVGNNGTYNVWEQGAARELKTGNDPNGATPDVELTFEAAYVTGELWFDPNPAARSGAVPSNKTDAYSVMLHELGHAIAYNGWRDWANYTLPGDYASTFDVHVSVQGGLPYFTGASAQSHYGAPVPLRAGNVYHWGNPEPGPGSDLIYELMNGIVFFHGRKYDLSTLDAALLRDVLVPVDNVAPAVVSQSFLFETRHAVRVAFGESVRTSINPGDLKLVRTENSNEYTPTSVEYDRLTNTATFAFATPLPDGNYRATIVAGGVTDVAGNALLPPAAPLEFHVLAGDANRDHRVNLADFNLLAANFGQSNRTFSQGDFNYDGMVNLADFNILASRFGQSLPPATATVWQPPRQATLDAGHDDDDARAWLA